MNKEKLLKYCITLLTIFSLSFGYAYGEEGEEEPKKSCEGLEYSLFVTGPFFHGIMGGIIGKIAYPLSETSATYGAIGGAIFSIVNNIALFKLIENDFPENLTNFWWKFLGVSYMLINLPSLFTLELIRSAVCQAPEEEE